MCGNLFGSVMCTSNIARGNGLRTDGRCLMSLDPNKCELIGQRQVNSTKGPLGQQARCLTAKEGGKSAIHYLASVERAISFFSGEAAFISSRRPVLRSK